MPVMPRIEGKAKKIAYDILGVPSNMKKKERKKKKKRDELVIYQQTRLLR